MIYLDHAATTACSAEVVEAMLPYFRDRFANASSIDHRPGADAKRAVDAARESIAALVGAMPEDVILTAGSTEANNLALSVRVPVVTTSIEHPSILDPFKFRNGAHDVLLDVGNGGMVDCATVLRVAQERPGCIVSIIATNNEVGTEQDVASLARAVHDAAGVLHLDGTQSVLTQELNVRGTPGLCGVSISAHKIYGPKGVGALIATAPLRRLVSPVLRGGGHERGLRSGTLNVPGIIGFGVAAKQANEKRKERRKHLTVLRNGFLASLAESWGDGTVTETVPASMASPHVLSVRLPGISGRALLRAVADRVAFSLGSACATNKAEPSHVLLALGLDKHTISETIRISFSAEQSIEQVQAGALILGSAARDLAEYSTSV